MCSGWGVGVLMAVRGGEVTQVGDTNTGSGTVHSP